MNMIEAPENALPIHRENLSLIDFQAKVLSLLERIATAEEGRARAEHADQIAAAEQKSKADWRASSSQVRNTDSLGLISPPDLAIELHMSANTLAKWRSFQRGPRFVKIGGHPMYRKFDVERWLAQGGECNSTRRRKVPAK